MPAEWVASLPTPTAHWRINRRFVADSQRELLEDVPLGRPDDPLLFTARPAARDGETKFAFLDSRGEGFELGFG